jgi:glutamate dehydrogenase/leucine dehydrogenase
LLKVVSVKIEDIYIPAARQKEIDQGEIDALCEAIMDEVEQRPIQVRKGKDRLVLIKGVNHLEAYRALGEVTVGAYIVAAQQY